MLETSYKYHVIFLTCPNGYYENSLGKGKWPGISNLWHDTAETRSCHTEFLYQSLVWVSMPVRIACSYWNYKSLPFSLYVSFLHADICRNTISWTSSSLKHRKEIRITSELNKMIKLDVLLLLKCTASGSFRPHT
jgi:hypothetical protein